tara:strand:+ start:376 stop:540 length:165 start_codon:yes stop_codon:yes gene_type:complete
MKVEKTTKILDKLNQILQDFQMLRDEIWIPDSKSCEASIDNVESIIYIIENDIK